MSDTNAQEPTMEEILASIRRIISEDDAPAADAAPAAEPEATAAPAAPEEDEEDVLELTNPEPVPAPPPPVTPAPAPAPAPAPVAAAAPAPAPEETLGDIEIFPRRKPEPAPAPASRPAYSAYEEDDGLISGPTASQAASAFGQLSRTVAMPAEGRTIEDLIREMLRPMLKEWLDTHLSGIVETAVQAEVERISRRRF